MTPMITNRRGLLKGSVAAATLAGPFAGLIAAEEARASTNGKGEQTAPADSPYGPIAPTRCLTTGLFLLQLPRGFSYRSFSFRGDLMADGNRVPAAHDGMAVVGTVAGLGAGDRFQLRLLGVVPEPSTWAMLIVGFGLVGGAMRRRREVAAA